MTKFQDVDMYSCWKLYKLEAVGAKKTFFWFHQPAYLIYVSEGDLQKEMSPVNVSQSKCLLFIPRIINSSNVHTNRKTKITSQSNDPFWNMTC